MTFMRNFTSSLLVMAGGVVLASPALAANNIPGVGIVIKKHPGDAPIIAPSDANGEVRITGLEPGIYQVQLFEGQQAVPMRVGADGQLAFAAMQEGAQRNMRRFARQIPFNAANGNPPQTSVLLHMATQFALPRMQPCDPLPGRPDACNAVRMRRFIDVNASPAAEIRYNAPSTSIDAAAFIVEERQKNGAFQNPADFAHRVCSKVEVNFDDASLRMGDTSIVMRRGGEPKAAGFKCAPRDNMVMLFTSWLSHDDARIGGKRLKGKIVGNSDKGM